MGGKTQMTNASIGLLLQQVVHNPKLRVQIVVDIALIHIVKQVEVEIGRLAFLQLRFKNLLHLIHVGRVVARKLGRQVVALSGVPGEALACY